MGDECVCVCVAVRNPVQQQQQHTHTHAPRWNVNMSMLTTQHAAKANFSLAGASIWYVFLILVRIFTHFCFNLAWVVVVGGPFDFH